jgi:SAM-dependent methyltransferase
MNCDFIAGAYRYIEYARFGQALEICRFAHLPRLAQSRKALILGEGDGRFLSRLSGSHPLLAVDAFDTSKRMIQLMRRRLLASEAPRESAVRLHHADATRVSFPKTDYDLVVTHFFFDVFSSNQLEALIERVSGSLAPRSLWLVSEFDVPEAGAARLAARFWLKVMYFFFRCATGLQNQTLPDWRHCLRRAGFRPRAQASFKKGFLVSELWERTGPW